MGNNNTIRVGVIGVGHLGNFNISFSLEINQIRNEMKTYDVRKPFRL